MNALEISNLVKVYANGTQALSGVDLKVKQGDFFALLGANGAGKTTIIGIITSLVNKTSGEVRVFGHDIDKDIDLAKQMIGVVPQEFNFSIFEKVIDIVAAQAGYFGVPRAEAEKEAENVLRDLNLWEKRNDVSRSLSGGMKRRLMIARALIHKPKLLILDEPTAGVDVELRHGMWEYLQRLNASGTTILLTTHYLEEAEQLCKNLAIIKQGEIVKNDTVKNVLKGLESQTYILTVDALPDLKEKTPFNIVALDENTIQVDLRKEDSITDLVRTLSDVHVKVLEAQAKGNRLEQLFLEILKS